MKKSYKTPRVEIIAIDVEHMIASSKLPKQYFEDVEIEDVEDGGFAW